MNSNSQPNSRSRAGASFQPVSTEEEHAAQLAAGEQEHAAQPVATEQEHAA
jgi:hypothetical protein